MQKAMRHLLLITYNISRFHERRYSRAYVATGLPLEVKSVSPLCSAIAQLQDPAFLAPQAQVFPSTGAFSSSARVQVHAFAGRRLQVHRGPLGLMVFSVAFRLQVH